MNTTRQNAIKANKLSEHMVCSLISIARQVNGIDRIEARTIKALTTRGLITSEGTQHTATDKGRKVYEDLVSGPKRAPYKAPASVTELHISHNLGEGSVNLCGKPSNATYRAIAEGTADRATDRWFFNETHLTDRGLCGDCLHTHYTMGPAIMPALLKGDTK